MASPREKKQVAVATAKQAAPEPPASRPIAVTGVSRHPQGHGSNVACQPLRQRGYAVQAISPDTGEIPRQV